MQKRYQAHGLFSRNPLPRQNFPEIEISFSNLEKHRLSKDIKAIIKIPNNPISAIFCFNRNPEPKSNAFIVRKSGAGPSMPVVKISLYNRPLRVKIQNPEEKINKIRY